jgi:transcriptional regulator with PAS, ATPase and Fis domain
MRGAFTGADANKKGLVEVAERGTIFLDEIGETTQSMQVKLLRVLQDRRFRRLGGTEEVQADIRIIAATNQDLQKMVGDGRFREDLFYRINVILIHLPPLRERPEDIPLLAGHFLERFATATNKRAMKFSPAALETLRGYPWPGNVRELQNAIERAVVLGQPPTIEVADLPLRVGAGNGKPGPMSLDEVERAHIRRVLDGCDWNISQAAKLLDIDRGTLYAKIRRYGFERVPTA